VDKRVAAKSPVRENCTPGSVRGALGNRRPYLDIRSKESATGEAGCSEGESPSSLAGEPLEFGTKELNGKV
jgi:hypothetical protein